ncbi:hypothetical protein LINPERPRIM_LOCUS16985 [Linum perenne]
MLLFYNKLRNLGIITRWKFWLSGSFSGEIGGIWQVYREGNKATDFLANRGHDFPISVFPFSISNCNLSYFLHFDCAGVSTPHNILVNISGALCRLSTKKK